MTLVEKIRTLANQRDMSLPRLEIELGLGNGTISRWRNSAPNVSKLSLIADYFNVSIDDLLERDVKAKKGVKIPVMGYVIAGIPIEAVENIIDYEEISEEMANFGEYFGLKIKGNSMEPRICQNDVVIVRKTSDAETGDLVIALINGDEATCKRLKKYNDGLALISTNPTYEPMYFSNDEVKNKPVEIIGKVVENRQKY